MASWMSHAAIPVAVVAVLVSAVGLPAPVAVSTAATVAPSALATPEDAIREYLAGVAAADAERILGASAIDEVAEGFRFAENAELLGAFLPIQSLAPAEYGFFADINRAQQAYRILWSVQMLAFGLLSGEEIDPSGIVPVDREWAASFVERLDPARLAGLEVIDIRFPDADLEHDRRYLENAARRASIYGGDDVTERLVLFSFEDQLYDVGFTLIRHGDAWKVLSQVSPLGNTSGLGTARPATAEDFERGTSGE